MRRLLRGMLNRTRGVKKDFAWAIRRRRVLRTMETIAGLPPREALRGSTVFFVPFAGVTPMFAQTCIVARTLAERGHRVFVTRCFRVFARCPAMDNDRLPYDATDEARLESCLHCADHSLSMAGEYGLDTIDLRAQGLLTPEMTARVDQLLRDAPADLLQFSYDGLPFGTLSVMDVVLARKISNWSLMEENDRRAWRDYLRSCLLAYLIVDRLCTEFGVRGIVHCNDYSLLLGARVAARKHGVPCHGLAFPGHRNADFRRYAILPNVWKPSAFKLLANWPSCRDLAIDPDRIREVAGDLIVRLRGLGSHIYSPAKTVEPTDIRRQLGREISTERKLLVAYTSSLDEIIASRVGIEALGIQIPDRPQPFRDQIEWLQALTAYVEASADLQLVVRIHPREGINKRESIRSQHLGRLREAFGGAYTHCRFVWPEDRVSSYDLGEAADLVLTSWTTIGLEMARLGAPVLVAFNGANVAIAQDDFLEWVPTPPEYFDRLRVLLGRPVTIDTVARAYRWYSLGTLGTTVDLTDVVPQSDFNQLPPYQTPREAATIEQIIIDGRDICDINVERVKAQAAGHRETEREELRRQFRRLVHFLMTGEDSTDDVPLRVLGPGERSNGAPDQAGRGGREMRIDGNWVEYRDGARLIKRYSPMSARLARLSAGADNSTR